MADTDNTNDPIYQTEALIAEDIDAYLTQHEHKTMLRFITCGSVDDGKSTLIGRLLYDSKMIFEDQLAALESDSKKVGTQGQEIDFALLVDGLAAEREQGITIDVAYRFFNTEKRKFIVADCPGHEQYTRNMVTGASTADLAVILIDARKGVLVQTRRHSYLCHLIGIKNLVLAVNKMDLVDYDQAVFDGIVKDYAEFAKSIGIQSFTAMPISGFKGDNIIGPSENTPWYKGPNLIEHLETVEVLSSQDQAKPFRMPVQWVNRPNLDFRGFSGLIATGSVKPGDAIRVLPSGKTSTVKSVVAHSRPPYWVKPGTGSFPLGRKSWLQTPRGRLPTLLPGSGKAGALAARATKSPSPALARTSVGHSVMSSPWKKMRPSVTSYSGLASSAANNVGTP